MYLCAINSINIISVEKISWKSVNLKKKIQLGFSSHSKKCQLLDQYDFLELLKDSMPFLVVSDNFTHFVRSSMMLVNQVELSYEKYVIP